MGLLLPALHVGLGPLLANATQVLPAVSALYTTESTNLSLWTLGPRLFVGTTGIPSGPVQYYLVLTLLPGAHVLHSLHTRGYPFAPTLVALLVGAGLCAYGGDWRAAAQVLSGSAAAMNTLPSLLTLGAGLAAGALGLLLAWLTRSEVARQSSEFV